MGEDKNPICKIGNVSVCDAEIHIQTLEMLLHYHERMMMDKGCPASHGCARTEALDGRCPKTVFADAYAEALKEAIRCIEIVHKNILSG